jgi:hypothetical protein
VAETTKRILAVRDELVAISEAHEEAHHDGQPCLANRVDLVAFLAHSLGMTLPHLELVAVNLLEYEVRHDAHGNGNGGG